MEWSLRAGYACINVKSLYLEKELYRPVDSTHPQDV